jgi:NADPH:quinone reductase-like Zn-dependent oxidoreductase
LKQSLDAIKFDGVISIIGFLGEGEQPGAMEALMHGCIIRGILVASRLQFEEMNRAIDANKIKPVVDDKIFEFEDAKAAYQYTWDQKHFGKTVIKVKA